MKVFLVFRKNLINLSCRDVDAPLFHLFVDERLGDTTLIVLVKDVSYPVGTVMTLAIFAWQLPDDGFPVFCDIFSQAKADVVSLYL